MASVLNRTTKEYLPSVNTPEYAPATWLINPDLSAVAGVPSKYWKLTGDAVSEMSVGEKAAVDAAEAAAIAAADKAARKTYIDQRDMTGIVQTLVDEVNILRQYLTTLKAETALASTFANLKTRYATLPNTPDRTYAQARTAIRDRIDAL